MCRSLPHCFAERTEQEGVFYSNLVFVGMLRHITRYCTPSHLLGVTLTLRYFNLASHYECFEKCSTPPIIFEKIELHFPLYIIINLAASVESELCRITLDYFSCLLQENSKNPRHNKWISDLDKV